MDMKNSSAEEFSVLRFTLKKDAAGQPTQQVEDHGIFASVESAFMAARLQALQAWRAISDQRRTTPGPPAKIELIDTEWGYDLRVDYLVVTRFWIHDRTRLDPVGASAETETETET
jgi:hypothetical protein